MGISHGGRLYYEKSICMNLENIWASLVAQTVRSLPAMQ